MALDQYRYLDREQIEQLFFDGRRRSQLKLRRLALHGLIIGWLSLLQPGLRPRPSVYLLSTRGATRLSREREIDPRAAIQRAKHARTRNFHLLHDLEANGFFVGVAVATRSREGEGLYHWVGGPGCRRAAKESQDRLPISDGWGRLLLPDRELLFDLEWDRGTEHPQRLRRKATAYVDYFRRRRDASLHHLFFVVPTEGREAEVQRVVRAAMPPRGECCRIWTTSIGRLRSEGPLAPIWQEVSPHPSGHVGLWQMPGLPRSARQTEDCIGKPAWWERRPGGGEGA
jgi:hypothetical protein